MKTHDTRSDEGCAIGLGLTGLALMGEADFLKRRTDRIDIGLLVDCFNSKGRERGGSLCAGVCTLRPAFAPRERLHSSDASCYATLRTSGRSVLTLLDSLTDTSHSEAHSIFRSGRDSENGSCFRPPVQRYIELCALDRPLKLHQLVRFGSGSGGATPACYSDESRRLTTTGARSGWNEFVISRRASFTRCRVYA
jgi:hypothetical protein